MLVLVGQHAWMAYLVGQNTSMAYQTANPGTLEMGCAASHVRKEELKILLGIGCHCHEGY
jgi:hypothetical protein